MFKKNLLFLACIVFITSIYAQQKPNIIPLPQKYKITSGYFELNELASIYTDNKLLEDEAHFLQEELQSRKSLILPIQPQKKNKSISLLLKKNDNEVEGAYRLQISNTEIKIESANEEGIFNGISSLIQLIAFSADNKLQCWEITDYPKYEWRGFMLDESRHFFGKEKVKFVLDWMAFYKLNKFHWHLTDQQGWRLEIKKYPLLTYIGGIGNYSNPDSMPQFYTQEDIKEIIRYAAERKITIIPEIDMPGHASAANRAYPEFSGGGSEKYPEFTFNPGYEGTYQYLTNILKETDVLFPSQMIHLGGDEVHFGNEAWNTIEGIKSLMKREGLENLPQVEKYFMVRMADSLYAMGNKFLAWDEMADISLPTDKTVIFWWRHDKPDQLQKALDRNYPIVICPRIPYYFDFVQHKDHTTGRKWGGEFSDLEKVYSFSTEGLVPNKQKNQVLGIQANLWTETVASGNRLDYLLFPRISALAESSWGNNTEYEDYKNRLVNHLELYKKATIYFYNPLSEDGRKEPLK